MRRKAAIVCSVFALSSCDFDTQADRIEKELKRDDSRPGYVGVLRALEVVNRSSNFAETTKCPSPIEPSFVGTYQSTISLKLSNHGRRFRDYRSTVTFLKETSNSTVSHKVETTDEAGLSQTRTRSWFHFDNKVTIEESVGFGTIAGPRIATHDESRRIRDAALAPFRFVNGFSNLEVVPCGVEEIDWIPLTASITNVENIEDETALKKLAISLGPTKKMIVEFEYSVDRTMPKIQPPESTPRKTLRSKGDEEALLTKLRKEGWLLSVETTP